MSVFARSLVVLCLFALPFTLNAQQPGSVQYNTVTMPAMQAANPQAYSSETTSWFAVAMGDSVLVYGAALSSGGKGAAESEALSLCEARGGEKPCKVVSSEAARCAALAIDREALIWGSGWARNT